MTDILENTYAGKRVFITGATGFKGSWLSLWLRNIGAILTGYSLLPETEPNHFDLLGLEMNFIEGDIRNAQKLAKAIEQAKPEIVFHLAAQPLVRRSYVEPEATFATNVMGTLNVFEACRKTDSVRAIVNITSDKCYENHECDTPYGEDAPMGGHDPYSASKGCAELLTTCYRRSFFNLNDYGAKHNVLLASCRAGNVIGGGDWAEDRLIPDLVRAASSGTPATVRNPHATRPWQHVLESLSGYMELGTKLLAGECDFAQAWNFGSIPEDSLPVGEVVKQLQKYWDKFDYSIEQSGEKLHEAGKLHISSQKAMSLLKWKPVWDTPKAIKVTAEWYKAYYEEGLLLTEKNITDYQNGRLGGE